MFKTSDRIRHEHYGIGKVVSFENGHYTINFGERGVITISQNKEYMMTLIPEGITGKSAVELPDFEAVLRKVLEDYSDVSQVVPLGDKWAGGTMILKPGKDGLKEKEVPIETFFHKLVMVRDRLRVLEQNINSNSKLSDEDKVNLQQYITRIYGSLTTFNVLFKNEQDYFKGEKKED